LLLSPAIVALVDRIRRHGGLPLLLPMLALGSCAAPVTHFGDASVGAAGQPFAMAPGDGTAGVAAAVREALIVAGFREARDAPQRVEVGFAVRPRKLAVTAPGAANAAAVISPRGKAPPSLCRRRAYVLTVAMVDVATGTVRERSGATVSRCHGTAAAVLPVLAKVAVTPER
jgi:hypothetical protein